ncbi:MAG: DUF3971 domain-containing protein [Pseudomonadota bacterium]
MSRWKDIETFMKLRSILLFALCVLGGAAFALYSGLLRTGGISIPGGVAALEVALAPYADARTLRLSPPRIGLVGKNNTAEMTVRAITFDTKDARARILLNGISAEVDGTRLTQGAVRFRTARIQRAQIVLDLDRARQLSADSPPLSHIELLQAVETAYQAAFTRVGLDGLASFSVEDLNIAVRQGAEIVALGSGDMVMQPDNRAMTFITSLNWSSSKAAALAASTRLSATGGPSRPLRLALKVSIDQADVTLKDARYQLNGTAFKAELDQPKPSAATLKMYLAAQSLGFDNSTVFTGERTFADVSVTALYTAEDDAMALDIVTLPLGAATLSGTLKARNLADNAALNLAARIDDLSVQDLTQYWPTQLAPNAREWIESNIEQGKLPDAKIAFASDWQALRDNKVANNALALSFNMQDMRVHYLRPMPPLIDAAGRAQMNLNEIRFDVTQGRIGGVNAAGSKVLLTEFRAKPQRAVIDLRAAGSATRLAQVLDSKPLEYFSAYDIAPRSLAGSFKGRARMTLPLLKSVRLSDVGLSARINARRLSLAKALGDETVRFQNVAIDLTDKALTLNSAISAAGMAGTLRWNEDFIGNTASPTVMQLSGQISPEGFANRFPLLRDHASGRVDFRANYRGLGAQLRSAQINADLAGLEINLPELDYAKGIGAPGRIAASFSGKDTEIMLGSATLTAPDLKVALTGSIAKEGSAMSFSAPRIDMPAFKGKLNLSNDGANWLLAGTAQELDLAPIIRRFWAGQLTQTSLSARPDAQREVSVSLDVKELKLLKGEGATGTRLLGSFKGGLIRQLNLYGDGPAGAPFTMTVQPTDAGRRFLLTSASAGELASGLGILTSATGGDLSISASSFEANDKVALSGLMQMRDIRLTEAPVLANLLGLGSLRGVADLARNRGLNFDTVDVPFEVQGGVVRIRSASAKGASLGLTADGEFLDSLEQCDIRGVIVPSYTINSALGKVPLIGDALVGGEDAGLVGINYSVTGNLANAQLDVNPATLLTPGFLRGIFGKQRGRLDPSAEGQSNLTQ